MRIGILAWAHDEVESLGLVRTAGSMGHLVEMFVVADVRLHAGPSGAVVTACGEPVTRFDVILNRAQLFNRSWQRDSETVALVSESRVPFVDRHEVTVRANCKVLAAQRLAEAGLPIAETTTVTDLDEVGVALDRWRRVVLKPSYGYGGSDVFRLGFADVPWRVTAEELLDRYPVLVCQPYLEMDGDVRVATAGSGVLHAYRRIPGERTWKANISQGADFEVVEPDAELVGLARAGAAAMGLTIAGCDIVVTPGGPLLLEVNPTPGWDNLNDSQRTETERLVIEHALSSAGMPVPVAAGGS